MFIPPTQSQSQSANSRPWEVSIFTLYPEMFPGPLSYALAGQALRKGIWNYAVHDLREFGRGKHRQVDDTPSGGGGGMVLRCDVLADALDTAISKHDSRPKLLLSPRGARLSQKKVRQYVEESSGIIVICSRFSGVDERVIEGRQLEEVSVGDYIASGGELPAQLLMDACIRLLPGVMHNPEVSKTETFERPLLEHPQYTRPKIWESRAIPEVLESGNHRAIEAWRLAKAVKITQQRRPDLLTSHPKEAKQQNENVTHHRL